MNEKTEKTKITKTSSFKKRLRRFGNFMKYLTMKWRFRLDQARAIFGLITFAALLAAGYVDDIPWFREQEGFWRGELLLTFIVFVIFMLGGYLYDRVFRLWSETTKVTIERNPYTYVPNPKEIFNARALWIYTILLLERIAKKADIEPEFSEEMRFFMKHYYSLTPSTKDFEREVFKLIKIADYVEKSYLNEGYVPNYDEIKKKLGIVKEPDEDEILDKLD